jgi:ketosteroid isomerase-like protein
MKKALICVVGVLVLATAAWSQSTEKAVAALENQWLQSQKTNNVDLLIPLLADKFINTSSEGKVTGKSETVAEYKTTKWTSADNTDVKVTVYGDTAIATGIYNGKGTDTGKPFEAHERWTDTWIKMPSGQWQCVASQGTPIKK